MNVKIRARFVARIFDILAWVILGLGILAELIFFFTMVAEGDTYFLLMMVLTAVMTALYWAAVSLAAVVAGYIEQKANN